MLEGIEIIDMIGALLILGLGFTTFCFASACIRYRHELEMLSEAADDCHNQLREALGCMGIMTRNTEKICDAMRIMGGEPSELPLERIPPKFIEAAVELDEIEEAGRA